MDSSFRDRQLNILSIWVIDTDKCDWYVRPYMNKIFVRNIDFDIKSNLMSVNRAP